MNYKKGLVSPILIATALSGVTVFSAHASCENTSPSSRLNPTELSDHGKCWLKKHRPEEQSGLAGDLFFVQTPNGDYFSLPVKTLANMPEDAAIDLVSKGVVGMIKEDVQEIGKVAAASQELQDLRIKINRKQERLKVLRQQSSDLQEKRESLEAERDALEAVLTNENAAQTPQPVIPNDAEINDPTSPSVLESTLLATEIDAPIVLSEELPEQANLSIETLEGSATETADQAEKDNAAAKARDLAARDALPANEDELKTEEIETLEQSLGDKDGVIALLRDRQDELLTMMSESKKQLNAEIDKLNQDVKDLKKELAGVRAERKKLIEGLVEKDLTFTSSAYKSDDEIRRENGLPSKDYFEARRNQNLNSAGVSVFGITTQETPTTTVAVTTKATVLETPVYASRAAFTDVFTATPIDEENSNDAVKMRLRDCDCELVDREAAKALSGMDADDFLDGEFENAVLITNPDLSSLDDDEASQKPTSVLTAAMGFKKNSEGEYDIENLVPANENSNKVKLKSDHGIDPIFKNETEAKSFFAKVEASVEESVATAVSKAREAYKQGYRDGYQAGYAQGFVDGYRQAESDYGIGQ